MMVVGGICSWSDIRRMARNASIVLFLALVFLIGRLTILSYSFYNNAWKAEREEQYKTALHAYNYTIRNYFPANPFVSRAIEGELNIADRFRCENKFADEQQTLQDLRTSLLSIRSFYQPYASALRTINERITGAGESKS